MANLQLCKQMDCSQNYDGQLLKKQISFVIPYGPPYVILGIVRNYVE